MGMKQTQAEVLPLRLLLCENQMFSAAKVVAVTAANPDCSC